MYSELEKSIATFFDREHCILTGSGTTALYCIYKSLDLAQGSKILYPNITCETALNAAIYAGLTPEFCDISSMTYNMDIQEVKKKMSNGNIPIVLASHIFGHLMDMYDLEKYADENGIIVIEDAAQAYGGELDGRKAGQMGLASIISFGSGKLMDCGGGGAILTDSDELYENCKKIVANLYNFDNRREEIRTNFIKEMFILHKASRGDVDWRKRDKLKMDYMDAYIFPIQAETCEKIKSSFPRLKAIVNKRRKLAQRLVNAMASLPNLHLPKLSGNSVLWRFTVKIEENRDHYFSKLNNADKKVSILFPPLHRDYGFGDESFPNSVKFWDQAINFILEEQYLENEMITNIIGLLKNE